MVFDRWRKRPPNLPMPTLGGVLSWADRFAEHGYRIQQNMVTGHFRLLDPEDVRIAWGTYAACKRAYQQIADATVFEPTSDHLVLVLHGIFRSKNAMRPMTEALQGGGYAVMPLNYPSTYVDLSAHARQVRQVLRRVRGATRVSFVCHSMGGLVARAVLGTEMPWMERLRPHRLVMVATPNQGAHLAVEAGRVWLYRALAGPAATQLQPRYVQDLPLPVCPFGVIAGGRGDGKGYNPLLPGDDDGTISLASARLDGAEDLLVVRATHNTIMEKPAVLKATLRYLETGRFRAAEV